MAASTVHLEPARVLQAYEVWCARGVLAVCSAGGTTYEHLTAWITSSIVRYLLLAYTYKSPEILICTGIAMPPSLITSANCKKKSVDVEEGRYEAPLQLLTTALHCTALHCTALHCTHLLVGCWYSFMRRGAPP